MTISIGTLTAVPASQHPELLGRSVAEALVGWEYADQVGVVRIDPELADTAAMTAAYHVPLSSSVNCVVVMGRRDAIERTAACLVRADTRADVNNRVRRLLEVRKASFLAHERAVEETGMEYGGITPIGLPGHWRLFVDAAVVEIASAVIGSGIRGSKLVLPGSALAHLPRAEVIPQLAT
ncbi:MAG: hypothetical protein M3Z50_10530 [Actinomycetota bacterium]|nr:hypothetical protein [Actinomycetota bacterium]